MLANCRLIHTQPCYAGRGVVTAPAILMEGRSEGARQGQARRVGGREREVVHPRDAVTRAWVAFAHLPHAATGRRIALGP